MQQSAAEPECLVLMPMLPGFEGIRSVVADAIACAGIAICRLEVELPDPEWQLWLAEAVDRADLVLADVTDHNPFVMYELGLAHRGRPPTTLMINKRNGRLPATLLGSLFHAYDDRHLALFENELAGALRASLRQLEDPLVDAAGLGRHQLAGWHAEAIELLEIYRSQVGMPVQQVTEEEFVVRIRVAAARGLRFPGGSDAKDHARVLLPALIADVGEVETMRPLIEWLSSDGRSSSAIE